MSSTSLSVCQRYLMALVLVDRLYGHHLSTAQVAGPADDAKGAVADHVQVAEGKGGRLVMAVHGRHGHGLVPYLLD